MEPMSEQAKQEILKAVGRQIRGENPPQTKQTLDRLMGEGIPRERAERLIACVLSAHMYLVLQERKAFDLAKFAKHLDRLPDLDWLRTEKPFSERADWFLGLLEAGEKDEEEPPPDDDAMPSLDEAEEALESCREPYSPEVIAAAVASYYPPVSSLLSQDVPGGEWLDYLNLGLDRSNVPELVRMATDNLLIEAETPKNAWWAPLHACRALAQLRAEEAIEPLVKFMDVCVAVVECDMIDDFPRIFACFGPSAVQPLKQFAANGMMADEARAMAGYSLAAIGNAHPGVREECIGGIEQGLLMTDSSPESAAFFVDALLQLKAREAYTSIHNCYADGLVWPSVVSWQDVQEVLGVDDPDPTPERLRRFAPRTGEPAAPKPPRPRAKPATRNEKRKRSKQAHKKNRRANRKKR